MALQQFLELLKGPQSDHAPAQTLDQGDGFMFQPGCQIGHLQPSIAESETTSKAPAIVLRWIIEDLPSKFKEGKPWISG